MFRADFLPFTSKIVEHSRYLPGDEAGPILLAPTAVDEAIHAYLVSMGY